MTVPKSYVKLFTTFHKIAPECCCHSLSINITHEQHLMLWSYSYKSLARSSISSSRKSMSSRLTCGLITTWRKKLTLPRWGWYPSIMLPFFIILSLIIGATWKETQKKKVNVTLRNTACLGRKCILWLKKFFWTVWVLRPLPVFPTACPKENQAHTCRFKALRPLSSVLPERTGARSKPSCLRHSSVTWERLG